MNKNADEFEVRHRNMLPVWSYVQERLRASVRPLGRRVSELPADATESLIAVGLEAHERTYPVDGILLAELGWTMDLGLDLVGKLLVDQPIRDRGERTTKYMDYLGIENGNTERPLSLSRQSSRANRPNYDGPLTFRPRPGRVRRVASGLLNISSCVSVRSKNRGLDREQKRAVRQNR